MSTESKSDMIKRYNIELKKDNDQKGRQIQKLRHQIDVISLSNHLQELNTQNQCQQCKMKQQQIQTLIKAIKTLTKSNTRSCQFSINNKLEANIDFDNKSSSKYGLALNPHEKLINNCEDKLLDQICLQPQSSMLSKLQETYSRIQINNIKMANQYLQSQIQSLKKRLQFYEIKIVSLQQINRNLKNELFNTKTRANKQQLGIIGDTSQEYSKYSDVYFKTSQKQSSKKTPVFSAIKASVIKPNQSSIPTVGSGNLSSASGYNCTTRNVQTNNPIYYKNQYQVQKQKLDGYIPRQYNTNKCASLESNFNSTMNIKSIQFPGAVPRANMHHDLIILGNNQQGKSKNKQSRLLQQRSRSLNHKIKILQKQNKRLVTDLFTYYK